MTVIGIHHLQVAMPPGREDEARRFYGDVLGLAEIEKPTHLQARGGCWFQIDGRTQLHLGVDEPFHPATKAHPALVVSDIAELRARFENAGASIVDDTQLAGNARFYTTDPFGDRLEIMAPLDAFADQGAQRGKSDTETADAGPWVAAAGGVEWRRGGYLVSTDPARLDLAGTAAFLASTYWASEIPESIVRRSVQHSIAFGLYDEDRQVGFARVVTDRATFAWVGDVFVRESHRGRGLGLWLMRCVLAHPELQELRRWLLASSNARGLYQRIGFAALPAPERFMEIVDRDVHRRQRKRGS